MIEARDIAEGRYTPDLSQEEVESEREKLREAMERMRHGKI